MNLIKLLLVCENEGCNPDPGIETTKTIKVDNIMTYSSGYPIKGAIIFVAVGFVITFFFIIPWVIGLIMMFKWIF